MILRLQKMDLHNCFSFTATLPITKKAITVIRSTASNNQREIKNVLAAD